MSDALYVAMAGAQQTMHAQAINSNNLANVTTPGFREDLYNANSESLFGEDVPSDVYITSAKPSTNFSAGSMMSTKRELDIAIKGDGWIAVRAPNGDEAYTRRGDLTINANGVLTTGNGLPVLGNGGPIAMPPASKIEIGVDGTISIVPIGQPATALAVLDRIKLVKPENDVLQKGEDGLFRSNAEAVPADGTVRIATGVLEGSNVNAVSAMVNIISLSRQFEMQMKIMQEVDTNGELTAQLLQGL